MTADQVLKDLRLSKKHLTASTTTAEDKSLWRQLVTAALNQDKTPAKPKIKPKAKAKARAKPPAERLAALGYMKAMEKSLQLMTGANLAAFQPKADKVEGGYSLLPHRTLSVVIDQGSDGWSLMFYLLHKCRLRLVTKFDIYHRESNDIQGAVKAAGQWSVCVLSGMVHNLNYGPWEGSAWFKKLVTGATEYFAVASWDDPLFQMLASAVARDKSTDLLSHESHEEALKTIFEEVRAGSVFTKKGPRTSFRRFFSWYDSETWHDQHWHSRLLIIMYIGLRMKIYDSVEKLPGHTESMRRAVEVAAEEQEMDHGDGDERDQDRPDLGEVGRVVEQEAHVASKADPDVETKGPVKSGREELKKLYAKCANGMYVAGHILGKPGLQDACRMIWMVGQPLFSKHSQNARSVRGVAGLRTYYLEAACGSVLPVCHECARVTQDLDLLDVCGFDTSHMAAAPTGDSPVDAQDPMLAEDNERARKLMFLVLNHLRFRVNSMCYHTDDLPGLLGLMLSDDDDLHTRFFDFVVDSFAAFLVAQNQGGSIFLRNVVRQSMFSTTFVRELAEIATAPSCLSQKQRKRKLILMAEDAFGLLGQTKIVEDLFKVIRDRETRDSATKTMKLQRQMHVAFASSIIAEHGFEEAVVSDTAGGIAAAPLPKDLFYSDDVVPSVDAESLVGPKTWPSLKPLHYPILAAHHRLLIHVDQHGLWKDAASCWQSQFLPLGSVFKRSKDKQWSVSLGCVGFAAVRAWPLDHSTVEGHDVFSLSKSEPSSLMWEFCLDPTDLAVIDTEVISPRHSRVLPPGLGVETGVCFLRTGDEHFLFQHAGLHGFWRLPKFVIEKIAALYGVPRKLPEWQMVQQLLIKLFPLASEEDIVVMLSKRGLDPFPEEIDKDDIPPEVLEDLVPEKERQDVEEPEMLLGALLLQFLLLPLLLFKGLRAPAAGTHHTAVDWWLLGSDWLELLLDDESWMLAAGS